MKSAMQLSVYVILAPVLMAGFLAGLAWVGLAAGFKIGWMWIAAVEEGGGWSLHIKRDAP